MKPSALTLLSATMLVALPVSGKDVPVSLENAPAPVQAAVKQYQPYGTLESIEYDENKKSGKPAVYEAKFILKDGKRLGVYISPEGKILRAENKEQKNK